MQGRNHGSKVGGRVLKVPRGRLAPSHGVWGNDLSSPVGMGLSPIVANDFGAIWRSIQAFLAEIWVQIGVSDDNKTVVSDSNINVAHVVCCFKVHAILGTYHFCSHFHHACGIVVWIDKNEEYLTLYSVNSFHTEHYSWDVYSETSL
jgi:hypothetical protein